MPSLRSIRNRIESVQNTKQITRAMKMVAAAKLRKAQDRIIETRPYAMSIRELAGRLAREAHGENDLLREHEDVQQILFVVVGSDRGLCGGFNNNLFREVRERIDEDYSSKRNVTVSIAAIGRKTVTHFSKRDYMVWKEYPGFFEALQFDSVSEIMKSVVSNFIQEEFDEVYLAYNEFESVIKQTRQIEKMLPIDPENLLLDNEEDDEEHISYIFEPDVEIIFRELLPLHLRTQLWRAVLESNAAEQGARMTSMDNATDNAEELEEDLQLEYNRARQSAITTEISEIMGGAQALEEA